VAQRGEPIVEQLRNGLIVSCQALPGEPLHGAEIMSRMALAARAGGAVGIRANGPEDVRSIKAAVPLPLIGLYKDGTEGVYITPTSWHARMIAEAGAEIIALDATPRPRPNGETLEDLIAVIHDQLARLVMADISTLEEGLAAEAIGADLISTTLAGYTPYSRQQPGPDLVLVRALVQQVRVPVIAEGRIRTPEEACAALGAGAFAVVVGGAITRPQLITRSFVEALG
jgi:N-acylglucosamine-6-phosphate 2-epimerase